MKLISITTERTFEPDLPQFDERDYTHTVIRLGFDPVVVRDHWGEFAWEADRWIVTLVNGELDSLHPGGWALTKAGARDRREPDRRTITDRLDQASVDALAATFAEPGAYGFPDDGAHLVGHVELRLFWRRRHPDVGTLT